MLTLTRVLVVQMGMGPYSFTVFIVILVLFGVYIWKYLPETKNKTYEELYRKFHIPNPDICGSRLSLNKPPVRTHMHAHTCSKLHTHSHTPAHTPARPRTHTRTHAHSPAVAACTNPRRVHHARTLFRLVKLALMIRRFLLVLSGSSLHVVGNAW